MFILFGLLLCFFSLLFFLYWYFVSFKWLCCIFSVGVVFYEFCCYFLCFNFWLGFFIFISIVMIISSMVIFYSIQYMGYTSYSSLRFVFLVVLFVFSMSLMIVSPKLLSILLGWDGLGLVSYCLVIYYSSINSYLAGLVNCLINRSGDIGLIVSVSWMMSYGSWHFIFYIDFFVII